ncbi:hypothetical protein Ocin01_09870 [Orchesella cincta]|uniref:DNA-directed RNA polymerase III subunit n=1 Tax=Orchesella cincta TaxID=48709 RepID=A0A1D2MVI1_ORCCI|nr:hypothetical protein Ocin01_09870 [Orchesella cincta]
MASPETKSVSLIIKQRQQSRSATVAPKVGGKAGGPGGVNQSLTPVLPPLYPSAPKPSVLNPEVANTVKVYDKLSQYFRSNFSIEHVVTEKSGFYVDRYTDQYKSPLALEEHLLHMLPDSSFPDELTVNHVPRKTVTRRVKRKIEDLPDMDEASPEKNAPIIKQEPVSDDEDEEKEDANLDDMDEYEDDVDEEMDVGTDYAKPYFDNGEGDDDDDRDEDEGATY